MSFTAKILSWRFRYLNILGCLLKRRPTRGGGGSRAPQPPPPLATPLDYQTWSGGRRVRVGLTVKFAFVWLTKKMRSCARLIGLYWKLFN